MSIKIDADNVVADLAELVLVTARKIQMHGLHNAAAIELRAVDSLVMSYIGRHPGESPTRIAAEMGLKSSNASAALRSLESTGLITRSPDPGDGRGVRVFPTPAAWRNRSLIRSEWAAILRVVVQADDGRIRPAVGLLADIDDRLTVS